MSKKKSNKVSKKKSSDSKVLEQRKRKGKSPYLANLTRPHTIESTGHLAKKLLENRETGEFSDPNVGLMSRKDYNNLRAKEAAGEDIIYPPHYNPVLVDLINEDKCVSLESGNLKNHPNPPKNWDEKKHGSWYDEYELDGEQVKDPTCWYFNSKIPRRCHSEKAENLIDNPEKNIFTFNDCRYVIGGGSHYNAACFMIWQCDRGCYRAADEVRKRMSLADNSEICDLVFRIEDKPNNVGGVTVEGNWKHCREMVYSPGQAFTAGNLFRLDGRQLSVKEIRNIDSDIKVTFKALESPIIGLSVDFLTKLWPEIKKSNMSIIKAMRKRDGRSKKYEAGNTRERTCTNILVHKRCDPSGSKYPLGLKGSQIDQVAFVVATGNGSISDGHFSMGVVIGARSNEEYNVGVHAVRAATKALETDAAPPVECDTVNDVVSELES